MRFGVLFAVLLCLCSSAAAWGPMTQKFMCHEAVKFVWGVDAVAECIPLQDTGLLEGLCETAYSVLGEEYQKKCLLAVDRGVDMHPSTVSYDVFGDSGNHFDFQHCPVNEGSARTWVCGNHDSRPAYTVAEKWFREAESAPNLCMRINYFCIAASYYADSEGLLRQVQYVSNNCVNNIEESIDRSIENGLTDWSSSQTCKFDNSLTGTNHREYKQRMGEASSTVNRIIANLTARGVQLKSMPYKPRKGIVLLANSIDYGYASEFLEYLKSNGVNVVYSNATEFATLKYNERVIILGGQNSPEGVGSITDVILSKEQEDSLLALGISFMFTKDNVWQTGQKVIVLAGNEAEDTRRACSENQERVLIAVRVIGG